MSDFFNPYGAVDRHGTRLPHWQQGNAFLFVTWRLADSLPAHLVESLAAEKADWLERNPRPWNADQQADYRERFPARVENWLDQGRGACVLAESEPRRVLASAIRHFEEERYRVGSFVIMPNHVHALFQPIGEYRIGGILHSWKSFTSGAINRCSRRSGELWAEGYWDRLVRDLRHFERCVRYIRANPLKARLGNHAFGYFENTVLIDQVRRDAIG